MVLISKEQLTWLEGHGRCDETGWVCQTTGADINAISTGRSIHWLGMCGGGGEVRRILHLYCRECNPKFQAPTYGTPIQESDLVEVG